MKCFHRKKIVLCMTAHQLMAAVWVGKKYQSSQVFGKDQAGQAAFAIFLRENTTATFSLIVDVAEEDYQIQQLPHTTRRTKAALLTRKLDQLYRGLAYRAVSDYGLAQNQTHSECYLFTALRHDKCLQPWLALLQAAETKLAGIYLRSMLSGVILRQHTQLKENVLLCEFLTSGLRQTFFMNSHLKMSRLLSSIAESPHLDFYRTEIEKTRLYLVSQRLIEADDTLHLLLLNVNAQPTLQDQQQKIASCSHIHLSALAKALQLPLAEVETMPELIHMQLLVNGSKVANLAPPALTEKYRIHQLKSQFQWLSVLLLAMYLSLGSYFYQQGLQQAAAFNQLAPQLKDAEYRYEQEMTKINGLNHDARKIKTTVALAKKISDLPTTPARMMGVLSSGFDVFSEAELQYIQLASFDWALSSDDANNLVAWQETAFAEMEITGEADKLLQRYLENLRSNSNVTQVELLPQMLDGEKQSAWHGNTAVIEEQTTQKYKLKITLKAKPKVESAALAGRQS